MSHCTPQPRSSNAQTGRHDGANGLRVTHSTRPFWRDWYRCNLLKGDADHSPKRLRYAHTLLSHRRREDATAAQRRMTERLRCCRVPQIKTLHDLTNALGSASRETLPAALPKLVREKDLTHFEKRFSNAHRTIEYLDGELNFIARHSGFTGVHRVAKVLPQSFH